MNKQTLLHKWMNKELSTEQEAELRKDPEMDSLLNLAAASAGLATPAFDKESLHRNISILNRPAKVRTLRPLKYIVRVAAVLAIIAMSYVYWQGLDTDVNTEIAEKTQLFLPDQSEVELNADSYLSYNTADWKDARNLKLEGEAFFKVAKGSAFTVETDQGIITVLGTQFNVFAREDRLNVSCFEGVVSVSLADQVITLKAGMAIETKAGKTFRTSTTALNAPQWLQDESSFEDALLGEVLEELEHYYDIRLQTTDVNLEKRFTGSFTHKDLDIALQSICNPLKMTYRVLDKNNVVLNEAE